jgi:hypothetical protein
LVSVNHKHEKCIAPPCRLHGDIGQPMVFIFSTTLFVSETDVKKPG